MRQQELEALVMTDEELHEFAFARCSLPVLAPEEPYLPTPEELEEMREFSGYYADNDALCIPREDATDDGTLIPEWVFN